MTTRPAWAEMHQAAENLLDILKCLFLALRARDDALGQQIYSKLPGAVLEFHLVAPPMEKALWENFDMISDEEKMAGAYLALIIDGAQEALLFLSGFGGSHTDFNQWYANLQEVVARSAALTQKETESN
ncbi:MAG: hypothetical protein A3D44_01100 [Candidatus Staskawiczbacteria bacterium RIFCSPHIGHO2_02_FULL_42_22]|uniref:Uncharacterized protein n=1 Tax=Candidatus Staskawiczbacteria bacterium RIFCSPHIGHO2_02_FULL_42_22 TaxID=1802207 RepID=A0A1G2I4C5_9BACT|nr:MAG: hypothetical protein A3D44_01100 [Candidatus Staskawiczbacteria bacterium RIFCSPHIGHO2_02_FULL_42_22]